MNKISMTIIKHFYVHRIMNNLLIQHNIQLVILLAFYIKVLINVVSHRFRWIIQL
ncbi:unnamed protein product [Schistosoma curassoni]|uniref:Uncharacterized protein n=1 Tax=Schistosoma curassoni TaxID=6186 RepID=A0A183L0N8_9TREM|nr:unnamed protein product [Schistosoma curassoni]